MPSDTGTGTPDYTKYEGLPEVGDPKELLVNAPANGSDAYVNKGGVLQRYSLDPTTKLYGPVGPAIQKPATALQGAATGKDQAQADKADIVTYPWGKYKLVRDKDTGELQYDENGAPAMVPLSQGSEAADAYLKNLVAKGKLDDAQSKKLTDELQPTIDLLGKQGQHISEGQIPLEKAQAGLATAQTQAELAKTLKGRIDQINSLPISLERKQEQIDAAVNNQLDAYKQTVAQATALNEYNRNQVSGASTLVQGLGQHKYSMGGGLASIAGALGHLMNPLDLFSNMKNVGGAGTYAANPAAGDAPPATTPPPHDTHEPLAAPGGGGAAPAGPAAAAPSLVPDGAAGLSDPGTPPPGGVKFDPVRGWLDASGNPLGGSTASGSPLVPASIGDTGGQDASGGTPAAPSAPSAPPTTLSMGPGAAGYIPASAIGADDSGPAMTGPNLGQLLGGAWNAFTSAGNTTAQAPAWNGRAFARGGRPPVGQPSLGGERGPEEFVPDRGAPQMLGMHGPQVFTPHQSGTVLPNALVQAMTAARQPQVKAPGAPLLPTHAVTKADIEHVKALMKGGIPPHQAIMMAHQAAGGDPRALHAHVLSRQAGPPAPGGGLVQRMVQAGR